MSKPNLRNSTYLDVIETGVGGVLCISAISKIDFLLQPDFSGLSSAMASWTIAAQVVVEVFLGCWMVSGVVGKFARRAVFVTFILFACYSATKTISGADSCGCFGRYSPSPIVSLTISSMLATLLAPLLWHQADHRIHIDYGSFRFWGACIASGLFLCGVFGAATYDHPVQELGGDPLNPSVMVVDGSDFRSRIGSRFPLAGYCSNSESIMRGRQVILLVRENCEKCKDLVKDATTELLLPKMLHVIDISGSRNLGISRNEQNDRIQYHQLDARWHWHFKVPMLIVLVEGTVQEVIEQNTYEMCLVIGDHAD